MWQVRFYLALHQWFAVKASAGSTVGYMHDASEAVCDFCRTAMEYFCRRWTRRKSFYKFCLTVVVIVSLGGIIFTQNNSFTKLRYALFTHYHYSESDAGKCALQKQNWEQWWVLIVQHHVWCFWWGLVDTGFWLLISILVRRFPIQSLYFRYRLNRLNFGQYRKKIYGMVGKICCHVHFYCIVTTTNIQLKKVSSHCLQ